MDPPHDPSTAAEQARARLHEEIERVRLGVEEMLADQGGGASDTDRVRLQQVEERLLRLEGRVDQVEQERRYAEWRMYANVERVLDDLLRETRAFADRFTR